LFLVADGNELRQEIKPFGWRRGLTIKKQKNIWMDENEVIKRCQKSDLSAYKMIYDRYKLPLLSTALRMLGQQQDAEDAVQMTFLNLHRGIQNYNYSSKFSSYLFRILINVCFDLTRKKTRRNRMSTRLAETEKVSIRSTHEEKVMLEEAIQALPERQRACFILFAVEELKQEEIAKILGISLGGVKSNVYHAKLRLQALLSNLRLQESP
jgi:RNA polymerase sigma factor (sigma-70 family)